MATPEQVRVYGLHKKAAQAFGIGQSTLRHKSLQGSLAVASTTGNKVYSGPGPTTTAPVTTDTAVWLVTSSKVPIRGRPGDETMIGRQGIALMVGQIPAIDDNGNTVTIAHDDLMTDFAGITYRINDPAVTPENGAWSFLLHKER